MFCAEGEKPCFCFNFLFFSQVSSFVTSCFLHFVLSERGICMWYNLRYLCTIAHLLFSFFCLVM